MRKNCSSVILSFFQVTKVEKRASRKRFLKSRRSRDFGMFSRCPFFNRGNLEKISNYTRTIFLTVCKNNYDNRVLFRIFWFFRMNVAIITLISQYKNTILLYLIRHFDAHRSIICPVLEHYNRSILCLFYIWKFCKQNFQIKNKHRIDLL